MVYQTRVGPALKRQGTDNTPAKLETRLPLDRNTPMAYTYPAELVIIETSVFTRQVLELLTDDAYRELQEALVNRPDAGAVIPGSGGLRKLRWPAPGQGKRGGLRVIYYWAAQQEQLLMLLIYAKSKQEDLTPAQLKTLKRIVEEGYP